MVCTLLPIVQKHAVAPDPLDAAFGDLRPVGAFYYRSELSGPWAFRVPPSPASFHYVEAGRVGLEVGGAAADLEAGDLAVVPHGVAVTFRGAGGGDPEPVEALRERHPPGPDGVLRNGPGPASAVMVCGGVTFEDAVAHPVLEALPPLLVVRGAADDDAPWLANTLRFLACESRSGRPGAATVMAHLSSVVFLQAVRAAVADDRVEGVGWLGAFRDPHVGPALAAIQRAPEAEWTVAALGLEAGLGRSAFAARFCAVVGESPMRHVARWRVYRAGQLLQGGASLAEAAGRVGYGSEAAFGRAFKRWTGRSPGAVRRAA